MNYSHLMIHYGELSTKGDNRKLFINQLDRNIRHALRNHGGLVFSRDYDHIYVGLGEEDPEPIIKTLQEVSGIHRISLVFKSEKDIETICKNALELALNEKGPTFKVNGKRGDKTYPLNSVELGKKVGGYILAKTNGKFGVDVHNPSFSVNIDVRKDFAYISCDSYPGAGGYPLGMNGKAMMLLSGGIDSPVASYLLLRRGIKIECIHFAAPPYTSSAVIDKLRDIIAILGNYQEEIKLHIVPFTKLQESIYQHSDESYAITIMRRMMMRIATKLAKEKNCLALATGESVGQVASQTLQSLDTINAVTNFPILRPLCVTDKLEVIDIARKIGTYDISIRPHEDCCTIFTPKNPKTKPREHECEFFESKWDYESMVDECVSSVETIRFIDGIEQI